jgi:hypothetical protein
VATQFEGTFEGLGNYISNFAINVMTFEAGSGLFGALEKLGVVRELHLVRVKFSSGAGDTVGGSLVGANEGLVDRCSATGAMNPLAGAGFGGLVGASDGKIIHSYAVIQINASDMILGGLVGGNDGTITESYSEGSIRAVNGLETFAGGLVGDNTGTIRNTYSMSSVHNGRNDCCDLGGLVGRNEGVIVESYSAGKTSQGKRADRSFVGGLVGEDKAAPGSIASAYWDVDKGVTDPSQGAGNIKDDPGITGLTTVQFQAGLPGGFDPNVWAEDEHVNHGFPHLIYLHK